MISSSSLFLSLNLAIPERVQIPLEINEDLIMEHDTRYI